MGPNKQQHNKKNAKIWQTKPDLVALYDIRPWNGAGLFLQPRSPHGAALPIVKLTASQQWRKKI